MKNKNKNLLKVNDVASRNAHLLIETNSQGKSRFSLRSIKDPSENGKDEKYWLENQIHPTNDRFMVAEGLRPGLVLIDKTIFIKTANEKELLKSAKRTSNNTLKDSFLEAMLGIKFQPKFNVSLKVA